MKTIKSEFAHKEQMSDALVMSIFLALSGGLQDAYTYVMRGKVFANAQTGNIVLMSGELFSGHWTSALRYLLPVMAFILGVFAAESIRLRTGGGKRLHWKQGILLTEMLIMLLVGFMPQNLNLLANMMISFSCAMQVQAFRKVRGNSYASTMCIGNLRSGTAALAAFFHNADHSELRRALYYFGVILAFAVGAGIGAHLCLALASRTIWVSCGILAVCFVLMELK